MKGKVAARQSTIGGGLLALAVSLPWIAMACWVNLDWRADTGSQVASVMLIAAGAVLWTAAVRHGITTLGVVYGCLAFVLLLNNAAIAFGNLHRHTVDARDGRATVAATVLERSQQREQLSRNRTQADAVAGGKPAETLAAEVDALIAQNANRWRATNECAPDSITLPESASFCGAVSRLRAGLAAARQRDAIDRELATLKSEPGTVAVSEADPFAGGISQLLAALGVKLSSETERLLPVLRDALRALLVELAATMAPAACMGILGLGAARSEERGRSRRPWRLPRLSVFPNVVKFRPVRAVSQSPAEDNGAELLSRFLAECTEDAKGASTAAGELWARYNTWCELNRIKEPGSQTAFGLRMGARYRKEGTGRPRYIGLRLRTREQRVVPLRPGQVRSVTA